MTLLENINSRPLPLARLMGITFTHAEPDKVIARMVVRPDLCTLGHRMHGGSAMALADTTGGAATLINLPRQWHNHDREQDEFRRRGRRGLDGHCHCYAASSRTPDTGLANAPGNGRRKARRIGNPDPIDSVMAFARASTRSDDCACGVRRRPCGRRLRDALQQLVTRVIARWRCDAFAQGRECRCRECRCRENYVLTG